MKKEERSTCLLGFLFARHFSGVNPCEAGTFGAIAAIFFRERKRHFPAQGCFSFHHPHQVRFLSFIYLSLYYTLLKIHAPSFSPLLPPHPSRLSPRFPLLHYLHQPRYTTFIYVTHALILSGAFSYFLACEYLLLVLLSFLLTSHFTSSLLAHTIQPLLIL